jgi:hypothetical protein
VDFSESSSKPVKVMVNKADDDTFIAFLRDLLNGPARDWKKATTAGDVLTRHLAVKAAIGELDALGWNRSTGGYEIPSGMWSE